MLPITTRISKYNFSSRNGNVIKYIVLHDTGNYKDSASNNANYFNGGDRNASAHYFVDDNSIWQIVEDHNASWHCGDGRGEYGISNYNSLGIEMCNNGGYISEKTINNTLELVKFLMQKYNIAPDMVVRHYDASRKNCPNNMSKNNWAKWNEFKTRLKGLKGGENKMDKELLNKQLYAVECSINSVMANLYKEIDKLQVDLKAVQDLKTYVNKNVK